MKVLIVTFAFPPANVIGAVRVGKLARYLDSRGHDVRVLTTDIIEDRSLPLEIAEDRVLYTDYRRQPAARSPPDEERPSRRSRLRSFLRRHYDGVRSIPDMRIDWKDCAISAGRQLIESSRPDIIFASAPPYTGLIVAARLARAFGIPWIADLRDLWVDNPYYDAPFWRRPIDAVIERHTLRDAAKLVTVSPNWAEQLRQRHGKATEVVYNGYAEEDFPPLPPAPDPGGILTIRYLGSIYPGFRDPSALFAAIALLPDGERPRVAVEFFCDNPAPVLAAAAAHHVSQSVVVRPRVPYRRALELQMGSDVLLLLQSSERRDEGNIPAKLFEYLYARR